MHAEGRNILVSLVYNGGFQFPGNAQPQTAGVSWESESGEPELVSLQMQAIHGKLTNLPSTAYVFYQVSWWVGEAQYTSTLNAIPLQPNAGVPFVARKVEVYFWGVTTDASGPNTLQNQPVNVACSVGPSPYIPGEAQTLAAWSASVTLDNKALVSGPCYVWRVRVHLSGIPCSNTVGFTNDAAQAGLLTLTGSPNCENLAGIAVKIVAGGVVGTATFTWGGMTGAIGATVQSSPTTTSAASVALGNTGYTLNFAAGTYVANDVFIFYPQAVYLMLFDSLVAPVQGASPDFVSRNLCNTNNAAADEDTGDAPDVPLAPFLRGCWARLSATPDVYNPIVGAPINFRCDALVSTGY